MAKIMNQKEPGHIPGLLIRLVLGRDFYEIIRMDSKVSNQKAKDILGWKLKYPSYKEGLEATINEIKAGRNFA